MQSALDTNFFPTCNAGFLDAVFKAALWLRYNQAKGLKSLQVAEP